MLDEFLGGGGEGRGVLLGGKQRGLILFREVNELNRTPEASTL